MCNVPASDSELPSGRMKSEVVTSCTIQEVQAVPGGMDGVHCTILYCTLHYCSYTVQFSTVLHTVLYTVQCTLYTVPESRLYLGTYLVYTVLYCTGGGSVSVSGGGDGSVSGGGGGDGGGRKVKKPKKRKELQEK